MAASDANGFDLELKQQGWPEEWIERNEQGRIVWCFKPFGPLWIVVGMEEKPSERLWLTAYQAKLEVEIKIGQELERKAGMSPGTQTITQPDLPTA